MAHSLGTGDKKSPNIELNVVPFIDVMSCLTAFLLLSVAWISLSRLEVKPAGRAPGQPCLDGECADPKLSVLIEPDALWVGVSRVNDVEKIPRTGAGHDWTKLEVALKAYKASVLFDRKTEIEVAAASTAAHPVLYQDVISAMDIAIKAGFVDVGVTDPAGLAMPLPPPP